MVKEIKFTQIGLGNMGLPIAEAIIKSNLVDHGHISLINRSLRKLQKLKKQFPQINLFQSVKNSSGFDYLLLAIKPQDFKDLALEIKPFLSENLVVISIMAGVSVSTIQKQLGCKKVVRLMPNLAIAQKEAVIGCFYNDFLITNEKKLIKKLFAPLGLFIEVEKEVQLNMITALAGSGPAYFAFLMNVMQETAEKFGFDPKTSHQIIQQTFFGTAVYCQETKVSPLELISKVKSKGGTTETALNILEKKQVKKSFQQAFQKAFERSKQLSK